MEHVLNMLTSAMKMMSNERLGVNVTGRVRYVARAFLRRTFN
eukprot:UN10267